MALARQPVYAGERSAPAARVGEAVACARLNAGSAPGPGRPRRPAGPPVPVNGRYSYNVRLKAAALIRSRTNAADGMAADRSARSISGVIPVAAFMKRRKLRASA